MTPEQMKQENKLFMDVLESKMKTSGSFRNKLEGFLTTSDREVQSKNAVDLSYDMKNHIQTMDLVTLSSFFGCMMIDPELNGSILAWIDKINKNAKRR